MLSGHISNWLFHFSLACLVGILKDIIKKKDAAIGLYELVRGENLRIGSRANVKDLLSMFS